MEADRPTKKRCGYYESHLWHGTDRCLRCGIQRYLPANSPSALARALGVSRQRAHQILHENKTVARSKVASALKTGLIGKSPFCYRCGKRTNDLEAHHWDYEQPLHVGWFCVPCHNFVHPHHPSINPQSETGRLPLLAGF